MKKSGEVMDSSKGFLSKQVNSGGGLHKDNMKNFHDARHTVVSKIQGALDYIKKEGLTGTAQTAVGLVANALEDAKKVPSYLGKESQVKDVMVLGSILMHKGLLCVSYALETSHLSTLFLAGSDAPPERGVREAEDLPCR